MILRRRHDIIPAMEIRFGSIDDLNILTSAEAECFPPSERAGEDAIKARLCAFPEHFLLLFEDGEFAAYINGAVTAQSDLTDEMFKDTTLHTEGGSWQMIFGLGVKSRFRGKGYAAELLKKFEELARRQNRLGLVLTCKPQLVNFYAGFGYDDEGICSSTHGNAVWHQMRLKF